MSTYLKEEFSWQGEFKNQAWEEDFVSERGPNQIKRMRFVCGITGCAYLGAGAGDYFISGWQPGFITMLLLRIVVFTGGAVNVWLAFGSNRRRLIQGVVVYMLLVGLAESYELVWKWQVEAYLGAGITVFIILTFYLFVPVGLAATMAGAIPSSVAYIFTGLLFTGMQVDHLVVLIFTFGLANGFGIYYVQKNSRSQRTLFRTLHDERTLNQKLQKEISIRQKAEKKLKWIASTDELTGVSNRRHFMRRARVEFNRALRHNRPLCILMIDVDHFKAVNDTHGHDAGDLVLKSLASTCRGQLRESDLFGRLGGEEFAALLLESPWPPSWKAAERLRLSVAEKKINYQDVELSITVSIGVACLSENSKSLETLLKKADDALYQAKAAGRNQVYPSKEA